MALSRLKQMLSARLIRQTALFDATWYRTRYPDIAGLKADPLRHYVAYGAAEGRDPSPIFDTAYYLAQFPELDPEKVNPLCHYIMIGESKGAWPNPYFDPRAVRSYLKYELGRDGCVLGTYLSLGTNEISPSSRLPAASYLEAHQLVTIAGISPLSQKLSSHFPFHLSALIQTRDSLIQLQDVRGMIPFACERGKVFFHVVDNDPHFFFCPMDTDMFDSGHYRLSLSLSRPEESLLRAKIYLDYGGGFDEDNVIRPGFELDAAGRAVSLVPLNGDVRRIRFDPVDNCFGGKLVYGIGEIRLERISSISYYGGIVRLLNKDKLSATKFAAHLAWRALKSGPRRTSQHLRLCHALWAERRESDFAERYSEYFRSPDPNTAETPHIPTLIERESAYIVRRAPVFDEADDVVILVLYSPDGRVTAMQNQIIGDWKKAGYKLITVINAGRYDETVRTGCADCDGLIVRENIGYDFGAWRHVVSILGGLSRANSITLTNDSVLPVKGAPGVRRLRKRIEETEGDILFCTRNLEIKPHFQSYLIALKKSAISSNVLNQFCLLPYYADKDDLIYETEVEIGERLAALGYDCRALYGIPEAQDSGRNPTIHHWEELIEQGFPFLKMQLVTAGFLTPDDPKLVELFGKTKADKLARHLEARNHAIIRPADYPDFESRPAFGILDDFNEYGAQNAYNPGKTWLRAIAVPFEDLKPNKSGRPGILAIVHCFYTDVAVDILGEIKQSGVRMRLLLTTDCQEKQKELRDSLKSIGLEGEVVVTPNRGRDVAPFLVEGARHVKDEEIILHLHTKKSKHDERYAGWGQFLRGNLLGSEGIIESILKLFELDEIGLVYSEHFKEVEGLRNWGYDFDKARDLLARVGCRIDADMPLEFPTSTMFWARRDVLQPLFDLGLDYEDFDPEDGQVDGTLAHAVERSFLYLCEHLGYQYRKVISKSAEPSYLDDAAFMETEDLPLHIKAPNLRLLANNVSRQDHFQHVGEVYPVEVASSGKTEPRLNLILPTLKPSKIYGGISTAIESYRSLADALGIALRVLIVSDDVNAHSVQEISRRLNMAVTLAPPRGDSTGGATVVDVMSNRIEPIAIRSSDIFFATAWWTADLAFRLKDAQERMFSRSQPVVYLIQDYEPGFYSWSEHYAMAEATYHRGEETLAIINSEELFGFMMQRYSFKQAWYVPYSLNSRLDKLLLPTSKEKIILCYGRPGTARNCFHILAEGIRLWQRANPTAAEEYEVVFAGEPFDPSRIGFLRNARVAGKMSLEDYADLLNRSAIGISLMISPHPSYPPLEMANAGCLTITNVYEGKNLEKRSKNVCSIPALSPQTLAAALSKLIPDAAIGEKPELRTVRNLNIKGDSVDFRAIADKLHELVD